MRKLLLLVLLTFTVSVFSQEKKDTEIEETSLTTLEKVPVFKGCRGNSKKLKQCFNKKMVKHLSKKFNSDIANELDLPPGETKIILMFKIDRDGVATDFTVKAAHEELKREAIRVMKLLPKFKSGILNGEPVTVKYAIPMKIMVEESKKKKN